MVAKFQINRVIRSIETETSWSTQAHKYQFDHERYNALANLTVDSKVP
jgi:hypothetical protein